MSLLSTSFRQRVAAGTVALLCTLSALPASASIDVAQRPLFLGANVPGHLVLVPSVEFPTVITRANRGAFSQTAVYAGYFDSRKCYEYRWAANEPDRHFRPTRFITGANCDAANEWSGQYLNWAATQTIDPFRLALTGGNRVRDTVTETWLQKARHDRNSNFPNLEISTTATVAPASPTTWDRVRTRIQGLGARMWFTRDGTLGPGSPNPEAPAILVAYNPALHPLDGTRFDAGDVAYTDLRTGAVPNQRGDRDDVVYEVSVRVAVCVPNLLEDNCVQYGNNWKPEGLIQDYAGRGTTSPGVRPRLKYSIFGYLNIDGSGRDGGVMRARAKYVGPNAVTAAGGLQANTAREWDPVTGVLERNPDAADATATSTAFGLTGTRAIQDSGVINYINRFGEVVTTKNMKSQDPVSELFYAGLRYLKNQGPVPEYSAPPFANPNTPERLASNANAADGFPVITNWNDPLTLSCQANVFLGIGDTNTWQDKNLPGPTNSTAEPAKPQAVRDDTTVDVVAFMRLINQMEAIETPALTLPAANASWFSISGHNNSAYLAALAYHANTQDLRPTIDGMQTARTFWVDVQEDNNLDPPRDNMYWLATKYGGFLPGSGFDPLTNTEVIPRTSWTGGDTLPNIGARPSTFFGAGDSARMVNALRNAFSNIVQAVEGSGASFATNTTRLESGARVYQASFFSGSWRGELDAFEVNVTTGRLNSSPLWSASEVVPAWASRDLYVNSGGYRAFDDFNALATADRTRLGNAARMNYLRGDRANEGTAGLQFRARQSVLGTFVNSQPVFVTRPDPRQFTGASFTGASAYGAFAGGAAATRKPIVYLGSNGGFLHGFNATSGEEEYAFMPNAVLRNNIADFASPAYTHRYQVDGDPTVAEVYDTAANRWRTILVGTMGRGARSVFALDITDPDNVQFLWERSELDIPALGNVLNRPVVAQVADGDWRVILGNGINGSGRAELVMIRAVGSGAGNSTVVDTGVDAANGLTGVAVSDTNGDFIADAAYGGDYKGNVWRFTSLASATPGAARLFTARDASNNAQPITASPRVGRNPADSSVWVFFGTGSYLTENDISTTAVQTWYGLRDDGTAISGRPDLNQVRIINEGNVERRDANGNVVFSRGARVIESVPATAMADKRGWYIDLLSPGASNTGERMVEPNQFQGNALIGTTRIPNTTNLCRPGGTGFIMAIDPFTGGRRLTNFFDVNNDNTINDGDNLSGVPVSGILFSSAPNSPTFLGRIMQVSRDDRGKEDVLTDAAAGLPRRTSWREIVNE